MSVTISAQTLVVDRKIIFPKIDIEDRLNVLETSLFALECSQLNLYIMDRSLELKTLHPIEAEVPELLLS
jgi:hypothetical protein